MERNQAKREADFFNEHLLSDCIRFWMQSDLLDREYGGYLTAVDRTGKCYNSEKSVWFQGRGLWTFSALMTRYGVRDEWMEAAQLGKKFLEEHCVDTDGRMFFTTQRDGTPLRKRRYFFSESFFVAGMAEYGNATGDRDALLKAETCFAQMLAIYRDPKSDPYQVTPKSFVSGRDISPIMVLLNGAQILRRTVPERAAHYSEVIREMVDDMFSYHVKPEMRCVLESVGVDGAFRDTPAGRTMNPGHSLENAWFLLCEAVYQKDEELKKRALEIIDWALERGWDKEYGGIYYFVDVKGCPCDPLEWDMKLWWVHNEAMIATLYAYALTGESRYWDWFTKIRDYAFSHFHDTEYGEWYGYLHRDGIVSHMQKGSHWKGPFHLPRCLMICAKIFEYMAENKEQESLL